MPDATIHWHQVNSVDVSSWEFQFQRVGSEGWEWVQRVEPTDGCPECFQAVVEIPRDAIMIRSRGIGVGGIEGEWSDGMSAMPEPSLATGLAICSAAIVLLARGRRWARGRASRGT